MDVRNGRLIRRLIVILVALSAVGCSGQGPQAQNALAQAKSTVSGTAKSKPAKDGADALAAAQAKLKEANAAMAAGDYARARRLAEEANADAELARAQATAQAAQERLEQLRQLVDTLRQQTGRLPEDR
jgi:uncharacterized protein YaiL (DUF2058 family)